jgi:hypothetical protein
MFLAEKLNLNSNSDVNFPKQYNQFVNPSIVASPVIQPTNHVEQTVPPPLPPMPLKYTNPTLVKPNVGLDPMLNSVNLSSQQQNSFFQNHDPQNDFGFSTTNMSMNSMFPAPANHPMSQSSSSSIGLPNQTSSFANNSNSAETFEQKWARIQAAKKTNPFAEDIAKKFEIKL